MTKRIEKINEIIRQKLSEILAKDMEFPGNSLVTITKVETSPDIKRSRIFITVIPEKYRGTDLEILKKNRHHLYQSLQKKLTTKFTPNLNFHIDEQEVFAQKVEALLDEIRQE